MYLFDPTKPSATPNYYEQIYRSKQSADRAKIAADVDLQSKHELMTANANRTKMAQSAALRQGRRRAGGGAFRQRGTVMPAVGRLDQANVAALATARRNAGRANLESQEIAAYGQQTAQQTRDSMTAMANRRIGFHDGAWYV